MKTHSPDVEQDPHDIYHSSLEVDDTSGWRVFIVPGLALLVAVGGLAGFVAISI